MQALVAHWQELENAGRALAKAVQSGLYIEDQTALITGEPVERRQPHDTRVTDQHGVRTIYLPSGAPVERD